MTDGPYLSLPATQTGMVSKPAFLSTPVQHMVMRIQRTELQEVSRRPEEP